MPPISPILVLDPIAGYAAVAATLQPGQWYRQPFDHVTLENPNANEVKRLGDMYPNATVLGTDGDVGSFEIGQLSLGACGSFAQISVYCSVSLGCQYRAEESIYPLEVSPIGLYFVRVQHPDRPLDTIWVAISDEVPTLPGKNTSNFFSIGEALLPGLLLKARATMMGGAWNEITNTRSFGLSMNWFPSAKIKVSTFAEFSNALAQGALCVFSMAQQYDAAGLPFNPPGVVMAHAFAAVDTISSTNENGLPVELVRIENPWSQGNDLESPQYAEDAAFWTLHPELADKLNDAKQSKGNTWVSWNYFLTLLGKTEVEVQHPFPIPGFSCTKFIPRTFTDETAIASSTLTSNLAALAQRQNNVIELVVPEYTVFQVNFKWAAGSGDRHTAMIVTDLNNKPLKKTNTVYWAASGTVPLYLNAGTYRLLPYTQNQMVDRGDLQILMMAKTDFSIKIGGAIA
jgi:Calpain family cysteine protease